MRTTALSLLVVALSLQPGCGSSTDAGRDGSGVDAGPAEADRGLDAATRDGARPAADGGACATSSLATINVRALASKTQFASAIKLGSLALDPAGRRLYVGGSKSSAVVVINMDTDTIEQVVDIGRAPNFLIRDPTSGALYAFIIPGGSSPNECLQIDLATKALTSVAEVTCQTLMDQTHGPGSSTWQGLNFRVQGFQSQLSGFAVGWRQDLQGAFGVIKIVDGAEKELGEISFGPDAEQTAIDQTSGKLYTSNTGDGSISVFDLNKLQATSYCKDNSCWVKDIDVGDAIEAMTLDAAGSTLYLINRLGGSVLYKLALDTKTLTELPSVKRLPQGIGLWPTGLALSADQKTLHVLSHYGSRLDTVDAATLQVSSTLAFYPEAVKYQARTDSISAMAFNATTATAYAVFPELGTIVASDVVQGKVKGTVDLTAYGLDLSKAANAGAGVVELAVNEKTDKLYAFLKHEQKLLVLGGQSLVLDKQASLTVPYLEPRALVSNDEKGVLYLADQIVDGTTLQQVGTLAAGVKVVAFDNAADAVYAVKSSPTGKPGGTLAEHLYRLVGGKLAREWTLDEIINVPSTFAFDLPRRVFYVGYFGTAVVKKYSLDEGCAPGGAPQPQGPCGDGVCDDIEKQSGKCPEDCSK